ncbi:MAG: transposase [Kosmotogaceae bacterium]|nr:transposase [Kosmotogaceae bacterium]
MGEKRKYSDELKAEVLKMIIEQGMSQQEVSELVDVPKGTIGNWVANSKKEMSQMAPGTPSISDVMAENRRLRKELAQAKMEKEILKKAAAYFAKESLPGTHS